MKASCCRFWVILAVTAASVVMLGGSVPRAGSGMHLRLVRAEPAADSTVTVAPTEIRLFFSEAPQIRVTTVKLLDATSQEVTIGTAKADERDGKIVMAPITGTVAPGTWTVSWRTMARDGHVVSGDFRFTLRPTRQPAR